MNGNYERDLYNTKTAVNSDSSKINGIVSIASGKEANKYESKKRLLLT